MTLMLLIKLNNYTWDDFSILFLCFLINILLALHVLHGWCEIMDFHLHLESNRPCYIL